MKSSIMSYNQAGLVRLRQFTAALVAMMCLCATSLAQNAGDFDPSLDMNVGADGGITVVLPLPDGRIMVGGDFQNIQGQPIPYLARLNADGTIDNTFNTGTGPSSSVRCIVPYGVNQFLIAGYFSVYDGEGRNRIAVINADGSLDPSFPFVTGLTALTIDAIAVQQNGQILVAGQQMTAPHSGVTRINANGTLDNGFNPGSGISDPVNPEVYDIHIQPDGKIILAGIITEFDGFPVGHIVRLFNDGSYDPMFSGVGADATITSITPLGDGRMVLTGAFTSYNGTGSNGFVVVDGEGAVTLPSFPGTGFAPGEVVYDCLHQQDGKLIAVGGFSSFSMVPTGRIIRFNADLSVDASFDSGTGISGADVRTIVRQWDGRYLLGGSFSSYNGNTANYLARIYGDSCFSRLMGTVTLDGQPISAGKVYVYTELVEGVGYSIVDSTDITDGEYVFENMAEFPVTYILQAVPNPQAYPASVAVPTFFSPDGPSHKWNDPALTYSLNSTCGNIDTIDITVLQPESSTAGPGSGTISGQLRWAENKVAAEDPIPIIDIVVERVPPANSVFAYTQTDAQGNYSFTDLPLTAGEDFVYGIHVSIPGIPMQNTYFVSITEEGQTFTDLDFLCDTLENIIYPVGNVQVGIQQGEERKLTAYPSPMSESMHVLVPRGFQGRLTAEVSDLKGSIISTVGGLEGPIFRLDGNGLSAGTYLLRVSDAHGRWESLQFMVGY